MTRTTKEQREAAGRCRFPGCTKPWFTTFSPRGPVCLAHLPAPPAPPPKLPTTPPLKPWNETEKD